MKIYLDTCCINRSFDNQSLTAIRQEAQAVEAIRRKILSGECSLVWSAALDMEIAKAKIPVIRAAALGWRSLAAEYIANSSALQSLAQSFEASGIKEADAKHLAAATLAGCNYFITADKRFLNNAVRIGRPAINPIDFEKRWQ